MRRPACVRVEDIGATHADASLLPVVPGNTRALGRVILWPPQVRNQTRHETRKAARGDAGRPKTFKTERGLRRACQRVWPVAVLGRRILVPFHDNQCGCRKCDGSNNQNRPGPVVLEFLFCDRWAAGRIGRAHLRCLRDRRRFVRLCGGYLSEGRCRDQTTTDGCL